MDVCLYTISCQGLINKLSREDNKTQRQVFVEDKNNNIYQIVDYYIDDGDIILETGDEV